MLVAAGGADHAVGGDDLDRAQIVAAQTVGPHHLAQPAAEGQPGHARDRDLAAGGGKPVRLGGPVDLPPGGAGLDTGGAGGGVDLHAAHRRQVDHQAVVADGAAGHLVAAAPDAEDRSVPAGDAHGLDDVGHVGAAGDHGRVAVDEPVPHPAGVVVPGMPAVDDLAAQPARDGIDQAARSSVVVACWSASVVVVMASHHRRPALARL